MAYDVADMERYIRQAATARGIDPDTAVRVARSEGLARGVYQSNIVHPVRGREPSYGPFQLLLGNTGGWPGGMGNDFKRDTGLDPSNPANAYATVDYALDGAARNGWGAWYGAGHAGISNRQGIPSTARAIGVSRGTGAPAGSARAAQDLPAPAPAAMPSQPSFLAGGGGGQFNEQAMAPQQAPAVPRDPNSGRGLLAMLRDTETPLTMDDAKTFLAGADAQGNSPLSGAATGLQMMALGLGGGGGNQAPQLAPAPIEDNRPDMAFMEMLMPRRKRMAV